MIKQRGVAAIHAAFECARAQGRAALMPYFTAGFPDLPTSEEILLTIAASGADLIEVGVPFSDPLADGPTVQHASQVALDNGITPEKCLELVRRLRDKNVSLPMVAMGYMNPILAYGVERYVADAAASGVDGLIVPDLPPEEAAEIEAACRANGLALIYLAAPTSTPERLAEIARRASGFLYLVSLTGVTGERASLPAGLAAFVAHARKVTPVPLAVGFGISRPEQARAVGQMADGVIVGSALIKVATEAAAGGADPVAAAASFVRQLRQGLAAGGDRSGAC
jgi:tryptophan synthase alpha chain